MDEQKPGDVITPNGEQTNPGVDMANTQAVPEAGPETTSTDSLQQITPEAEVTVQSAAPAPEQPVQLPGAAREEPPVPHEEQPKSGDGVSWTASEFIHNAKSFNWYLILAIVGILGAIGVYFLTKDIISTAAIAVVAVIFGISAGSKPRVLPYEIGASGVKIGDKQYYYSEFKTFSVLHDSGAISSVQLMPLKRFAVPVNMYFPPEEEQSIVEALSQYLPYEERKMDATDRLLHRLRF